MSLLLAGFLMYGIIILNMLSAGGPATRPHEFTYWGDQSHRTCVTCHHVHRPTTEQGRWQPKSAKPGRFSLYETRRDLPSKTSLMCLSCHDGAIAKEIHLGNRQTVVTQVGQSLATRSGGIGAPFSSHPVGVAYNQRNDKLVPMNTVESDGQIRLPNGRVECVSCHDPHGTEGHDFMLVKSNRRSALCLSCHRL